MGLSNLPLTHNWYINNDNGNTTHKDVHRNSNSHKTPKAYGFNCAFSNRRLLMSLKDDLLLPVIKGDPIPIENIHTKQVKPHS